MAEVVIPVWEKYALSLSEAAEYFGISEKRLREVVNRNPRADYIVWNGIKCLVKRKKFEAYLDNLGSLDEIAAPSSTAALDEKWLMSRTRAT